MRKTVFIKNAAIMAASSLILRFAGIVFRVWTAARIGSEGLGLYQLALSVYLLCSTFASTGLSTAVTRMVSDNEAVGDGGAARSAVRKSAVLALLVCAVLIPLLFFGADFLAVTVLKDARTAKAIQMCGFALPFVSLCACFKGYFLAKRHALIPCLSQLLEQAIRISVVILLLSRTGNNLSDGIAAITLGDVAAEASACAFLFVFWRRGRKGCRKGSAIFREILRITLPISGGKYVNSLLRTWENILTPIKLTVYYAAKDKALSAMGVIKGMALPILLFPYSLLGAVSTLLIPEMSAAAVRNRTELISETVVRAIRLTMLFSFGCAAVFYFAGEPLGLLMYSNSEAGRVLKVLSPLVPLMYLDSISDSMLKGLDQQMISFRNLVSDSVIRIILIFLLLSSGGMTAFIGIMYFSNIYTSGLNTYRLLKVTGARPSILTVVVFPFISASFSGTTTRILLIAAGFTGVKYIISFFFLCLPMYFLLLLLCGCVNKKEVAVVLPKRTFSLRQPEK